MKRAPALIAVAALGVTVAVPAGAATPPAEPVAAATCAKDTKRLKTFKRGMKAAKKRFFRTHHAKKARARFLKQQKAKLARLTREFTLTQDLFYHLDATLGGSIFGDTTAGVVSLRLASSQNAFYQRTTAGSDSFGGFMSAGTYEIEIEVDCSPGNDGGTCTGNWSFKLEIGDLIAP